MDELSYWKLKAQLLSVTTEITQLEAAYKEATARRDKILLDNKYELGKNYKFNDEKMVMELMN